MTSVQPSMIDPTHPLCPECTSPMLLNQIVRESEERVHQHFECTALRRAMLAKNTASKSLGDAVFNNHMLHASTATRGA